MLNADLTALFHVWRTRTSDVARLWGLALGADLALVNNSRLDCLYTGYSRALERQSLQKWWSVQSTEELRRQLEWLFEGGHDEHFGHIVHAIREEIPFRPDLDKDAINRIAFVRQLIPGLRATHVRGFDLGRVPALARFGYSAGYIGASETWSWISRAAKEAQPVFTSWKDFAENYRLGFEFWNSADPENFDYFKNREFLLNSSRSPWVRLDWKTPLEPMHSRMSQ